MGGRIPVSQTGLVHKNGKDFLLHLDNFTRMKKRPSSEFAGDLGENGGWAGYMQGCHGGTGYGGLCVSALGRS